MALEERVRLAAPDGLVAEVDGVTGRRYKATGGGMYEMHPKDAAAFKREGAFTPSVGGVTRGGYICPGCGFRPVVRTCSRCGHRAETVDERWVRLNTPGITVVFDVDLRTGDVREVGPARRDRAPAARAVIFGEGAHRSQLLGGA